MCIYQNLFSRLIVCTLLDVDIPLSFFIHPLPLLPLKETAKVAEFPIHVPESGATLSAVVTFHTFTSFTKRLCALGCLEIDLLLGLSYVRKKL